ncbi:MAG: transposase [Candidatus Campbellbacteria bacterium]
MKLIAQVKLQPTEEQRQFLLQTLEQANAVCDQISAYAWEHKTFRTYDLHHALYHALREQSGLTAQLVVRLLAKVSDSYKKDKKTQRHFRPHGAIAYDDRILRWYTDKQRISIWSVGGRLNIPYQCGQRQREMLVYQKGESDLVYSKTKDAFYLLATCDIPDPTEHETDAALGVDLGRTNIAVDSDGEAFTSDVTEVNRIRKAELRRRLQKRGSKSAKRHLKKLSGKQRRFQRDVNHCISKRLVQKAERTGRGIRLEDLKGINRRTRVKGKEARAKQYNWSFAQLRAFITYKAAMRGVRVELVDPRYTSQRCFACGNIDKANRKTQADFSCTVCGHTAHADVNAAKNISSWASVNAPTVSDTATTNAASIAAVAVAPGTSLRL